MSEFFYTRVVISKTEDNIVIDEKKKRAKISFKNIRQIFETLDDDNKRCIMLEYHNDSYTTIYDDFERVDKLHEKYLKGISIVKSN